MAPASKASNAWELNAVVKTAWQIALAAHATSRPLMPGPFAHQCKVGTGGVKLGGQGHTGADRVVAHLRDGRTQVVDQMIDDGRGTCLVRYDGRAHAGQGVEQEVRFDLRRQHRQAQFCLSPRRTGALQALGLKRFVELAALAREGDQVGKAAQPGDQQWRAPPARLRTDV